MAGVAQLDDFDQQLYKVTKGGQGRHSCFCNQSGFA